MSKEPIVSLRHITRRFKVGEGEFTALSDVNLDFEKGEFAGFVGPSGSGKTTLLNIIGSLDRPSEGKVTVMGKDISKLSHRESAKLRNIHIGFIFQTVNLLPVYTVYENVEFALLLQKRPDAERKRAVTEALEWVGMAHLAGKRPHKLSGGEGQRVAIARAIVKRPELLVADEPTANLDAENAHSIMKTMRRLNRDLDITFLFSTHDEKVMQYMDRIIHLRDGKVEKDERINRETSAS